MFKPPLKIRDRKGLLKLLRQYDMKGLGGILLDDVQGTQQL
jgi:transcription initiation factor TFIIE subunit beta